MFAYDNDMELFQEGGNNGLNLVLAVVSLLVVVWVLGWVVSGKAEWPVNSWNDMMGSSVSGSEPYAGCGANIKVNVPDGVKDPFFNSEKLMPELSADAPEWTKAYKNGQNMLLQGNFIDATAKTEEFQLTKSVCGRRYQSHDLRKVPTVTRDPTTVNSFALPVIDPGCTVEYNAMWGNLDPDCNTNKWVPDEDSLAKLGYPVPPPKYVALS